MGVHDFGPGAIVRSVPDLSESAEPFWGRVAVSATWCEAQADVCDPRGCLRRAKTRPRVLEKDYFSCVSRIAVDLDHEVRVRRLEPVIPADFRLLVYFPDDELADGAAESESEGFFDVHNCPPWETWVAMVQEESRRFYNPYLVAYVPAVFVDLVDRAIDGPAEDCIGWLEDYPVAMREVVRARTG